MKVIKLEVHPTYRIWTLSRPNKTKHFIVRENLIEGVTKNTYQIKSLQGEMSRNGMVSFTQGFKGSYFLPVANILLDAINIVNCYQDIHGNLLPDMYGYFPITVEGISWTL